jgi:hypothetical protein
MNWIARRQIFGFLLLGLCAGCSSPGYMGNRVRDAADIFTVTAGLNYGAKARVGPFRVGLFGGSDYAGLRAGEMGLPFQPFGSSEEVIDLEMTAMSAENFEPDLQTAKRRGKLFMSEGMICFAIPDADKDASRRQQAAYFSECEVAVGLFGGLRLGFNPGELLDFILGWTTLDLYDDDLRQEEANKPAAGNAGIASQLTIGHHWPGVPEPERSL